MADISNLTFRKLSKEWKHRDRRYTLLFSTPENVEHGRVLRKMIGQVDGLVIIGGNIQERASSALNRRSLRTRRAEPA